MNVASDPPITDDALFHCQQAVEKALKGVLKLNKTLEPLLKQATELTPYATMFRYPGELELPPLEDATAALKIAQEVFAAILSMIPAEAHPGK